MRALTKALMRAPNKEIDCGQCGCWQYRAAQGWLMDWLAPNKSPQPTQSVATGIEARRWLFVFRLLGKATFVK